MVDKKIGLYVQFCRLLTKPATKTVVIIREILNERNFIEVNDPS